MTATLRSLGVATLLVALLVSDAARGQAGPASVPGNTLLVPAYSHIYIGRQERPFPLTITLAIRNTDATRSLTLSAVDYHDSAGRRVRSYLDKPVSVAPLQSAVFVVKESEQGGDTSIGGAFRVVWSGDARMDPPLAEAVMIGAAGQQGISFTSRGVPVSSAQP